MANFIKCKTESITYKKLKKEFVGNTTESTIFWFKKTVPIYKDVFDEEVIVINNPVNINLVLNIEKNKGAADRDSEGNYDKKTARPGIKFDFGKYHEQWYYNDEKIRDEQFEEIANNNHLYKTKVLI